MREILFVAGEASGDLHAAGVARELRNLQAPFELAGIGGDAMRTEGVSLLEHSERLAVMGFVEVLRHVPKHYALLRALRRRLRSGNTALLILIDYPGFNMKLAAAATAAGVPVLYYITPQVWAWGAGRLSKLARTVTRAAVILPFEEKMLREHGVDATFVGQCRTESFCPCSSSLDSVSHLDAYCPKCGHVPNSYQTDGHSFCGIHHEWLRPYQAPDLLFVGLPICPVNPSGRRLAASLGNGRAGLLLSLQHQPSTLEIRHYGRSPLSLAF